MRRGSTSFKKYVIASLLLMFIIGSGLFAVHGVWAQDFGTGYLEGVELPSQDIRIVIVNIIRIALGVLGVIALSLIIAGGYIWMTAAGNESRILTAKKVILNAVIGLIIIFLAFAITTFVFNVLQRAAQEGGPGGPGSCPAGAVSGCTRCQAGGWIFDGSLPGCSLPGSSFGIRDLETAHAGSTVDSDVYLCSSVQAQFNNQIDPTTVAGNARLTAGTAPVSSTLARSARSLEIIPESNLLPETTYTAHYSTALKDTTGLFLSSCAPFGCSSSGGEYVWSFTTGTELDSGAPTIVSSHPIFDPADPRYPNRNADRDEVIKVNFSEAVRASTLDDGSGRPLATNIILAQLDGQAGSVVATVAAQNLVMVTRSRGFDMFLAAPDLLEPFTWYRVTVQNVTDLCGNPMTEIVTWEFETNDKAPSVRGFYPTGSNVCPGVGVLTVSFNTSMEHDLVGLTVSERAAGNPPILSAALRAINLAPGPYQVSGQGGVWSVDADSGFRSFTFIPNSPLSANTRYFISISTDRVIDPDGTNLAQAWDFTVTDAAACSCAPYISSINPDQGLLGQCVTIKGRCLQGAVPGDSDDPRFAQISALTFNSVPATIGGQARNFVTTSIPDSFSQGDSLLPQVTITYNDTALGSLTTDNQSVDFFISSEEQSQGPCLLDVSPAKACFADNVRLQGLRFGADPGSGNRATPSNHITFTNGLVQTPDIRVTSWSDTRIQTLVPTGASDGNVSVTAGGLSSNSLPFDLACSIGSSCSGSASQCAPDSSLCRIGLECNTATCLCEAVEAPGTPKVVERFPTCTLSCTNATLGARFNLDMDPASFDAGTVDVLPCLNDSCVSLGSELALDSLDYDPSSFQLDIVPATTLEGATKYRVILWGTIKSAAGVSLGGLNFDRDNNGQLDSYTWIFGTKDGLCELTGVSLDPVIASADRLGQRVGFVARAQGANDQCGSQQINGRSLVWQWSSSQPTVASISSVDSNSDSRVDERQRATVLGEGETIISAQSASFSADSLLKVNIITCDESTDCAKSGVCLGSVCDEASRTCTPVINSLAPAVGPPGRWSTIQGCYFGSQQGAGQVSFGAQAADLSICGGDVWQSHQIIIEVPLLSAGDHDVVVKTHRGLTSNAASFTVTEQCLPGVPIPEIGVPGLCRLRPSAGAVKQTIKLEGRRFGATEAQVTWASASSRLLASIESWQDLNVLATVPTQAVTGNVLVLVNSCPSNALPFTVTAGPGTACNVQPGSDQCVPDDRRCGRQTGLVCDVDTCTCVSAPAPSVTLTEPQGTTNVCRNALIELTFDQLMDRSSLTGNVFLESDQVRQAVALSSFDQDTNNDGVLDVLSDQTIVRLTPPSLTANKDYQVHVTESVKNRLGIALAAEFTQTFRTGSEICQIDHVSVRVFPPGTESTRDLFTCAGRNDCPDDQATGDSGNQHRWLAQAETVDNRLINAQYHWSESDPDELFSLSSVAADDILITPVPMNGRATFAVGAHDPVNLAVGAATSTVVVENVLCENPWPSRLDGFPFIDSSTGFSTYYCRDSRGELLPALDKVESAGQGDVIKEFLLLRGAGDVSTDAIALRVVRNLDHLSPNLWYNAEVPNPGGPQSTTIDGFEAVRDGRTLYVNAARVTSAGIYTNIYLISYNEGADSETIDIYNQLTDNWRFTLGIDDLNTCSGDDVTFCKLDTDCSQAGGTCQLEATKLRRDTKRISDLGGLAERLRQYRGTCSNDTSRGCLNDNMCQAGGTCNLANLTYPRLPAGTFIPGQSTSRWPSWHGTLGPALSAVLAVDPVNEFSSCPAGFDQAACWDENAKEFSCAPGSYLYQYVVSPDGSSATLYTNMEYKNVTWLGNQALTVGAGDDCRSFSLNP